MNEYLKVLEENEEVRYIIKNSYRLNSGHQGTVIRENTKIQRNDLCPCESGKKYKKCCLKSNQ